MREIYSNLKHNDLLEACGVLESTLIEAIGKLEDQGIDTTDLRSGLNRAHAAVDGLRD